MGCWVPATFARIRLLDQILVRMASVDEVTSILDETSAFFEDSRELAYAMQQPEDERALVLIDELGRTTSSLDGVGICWAACECFMRKPSAFTLLVTHYFDVCKLASLYPRIANLHMRTSTGGHGRSSSASSALSRLKYSYQAVSGALPMDKTEEYGLKVAKAAGYPEEIVIASRETAKQLRAYAEQENQLANSKGERQETMKFEVRQQLHCMHSSESLQSS
jgi:DNA mismatch repair protein MSH4